jgi:hypothetical protein
LSDGPQQGKAWENNDSKNAFKAACPQPETRVEARKDFFIWIRRNPLKSPDSAKGIQGNPSFFAWIYLVFLAFIWR